MKKIIIAIALMAIYFFSAYSWYSWVQKAFSKNGRYANLQPGATEVVIMFIPLFNTAFAIFAPIWMPPTKEDEIKMNFNKFFSIEK